MRIIYKTNVTDMATNQLHEARSIEEVPDERAEELVHMGLADVITEAEAEEVLAEEEEM